MRKLVVIVALCAAACSDPVISLGPSDAQIRGAYLETGDVLLGNDLLSGDLQLSEFKKISCRPAGQGLFRCKFYAKFGLASASDEKKLIDHIVGSQSGYFREAMFFQNSEGKWICTDVTNFSSPATSQGAGVVDNE